MSEEKKIKVVLLEPGKLARTAEIGTSIEDLQNAVDGLIEPFYPFEERRGKDQRYAAKPKRKKQGRRYGRFHFRPRFYM